MSLEGRLTLDKFGGNSSPVNAPLYSTDPKYYRSVKLMTIVYKTDPEAALDLLPEGLTLVEPATCVLLFGNYPCASSGAYKESGQGILCQWNGELKWYVPQLVVTTPTALISAREIWGYPKKIGTVHMEQDGDIIMGKMERPKGISICSGGMRLKRSTKPEELLNDVPKVVLKIIPSPKNGAPYEVAELVQIESESELVEGWSGEGWVQFNATSIFDPWHKLPIKKVLNASYRVVNLELKDGTVLKKYV